MQARYLGASGRRRTDAKISMAYRYILESFPRLGRGPTMTEMTAGLRIGKNRRAVGVCHIRSGEGANAG